MRISAHFLRGDVNFFPCASAVGVSPSARRGEKRGAFRENAGAFRLDLPEGRTDLAQALRRMATEGVTGVREGAALWALTDEGAR